MTHMAAFQIKTDYIGFQFPFLKSFHFLNEKRYKKFLQNFDTSLMHSRNLWPGNNVQLA